MQTYASSAQYKGTQPTVVTIGTFDGVHAGHRVLLGRLTDDAKAMGCESVIFTMFPHPRMVLQPDVDIKLIQTIDEREAVLDRVGIDHLVIEPFTKEFSRMSAEDFVQQLLVEKLNAKKVIIGYDHRFGRNRRADVSDLRRLGEEFGFEVEEVGAQEVDAITVSSTKIRKALMEGDLDTANTYLADPFTLTGTIAKGRGLGRQLGYPTANLEIAENYKLIPKNGVYIVKSQIDKKSVFGVMNIGNNPTVGGDKTTIETYFMDFEADLYGHKLQIELLSRIRDEQRFGSTEELTAAIAKDQKIAEAYVRSHQ
ncbi:bifunctional riboflavin kinase/FAD synthetase [Gilvibacter sediminis]|uniref:bifunctional riboflavin kinase/FAD synthetase n=1 Tax=Gilvibacter sediminis TaxID=379071 RepID=UPI00234FFA6B|nr:bifunctional riboflavin kinase/FAD synthetase [Gilvibacter sediminis]MDC7996558.1 bifunctional riboflavin kinase/FAD synthetase [Gilvibacter sediminis]